MNFIFKNVFVHEMFGLIKVHWGQRKKNQLFLCDVEERADVSYLDLLMIWIRMDPWSFAWEAGVNTSWGIILSGAAPLSVSFQWMRIRAVCVWEVWLSSNQNRFDKERILVESASQIYILLKGCLCALSMGYVYSQFEA